MSNAYAAIPSHYEARDTGVGAWKLCIERAGREAGKPYTDARGCTSYRVDSRWEPSFDVFLRHEDGSRVPLGANMHSDPEPEAARLIRMLTAPLKESVSAGAEVDAALKAARESE